MGGYLGTPQRQLKKRIGNVTFTIHRLAEVVNWRDPDVSFAYLFCGSQGVSLGGAHDPAKEAAERGRQKAEINYFEPEWLDVYDLWAKSLRSLGKVAVEVWDHGYEKVDANSRIYGKLGGKDYEVNLYSNRIEIVLRSDQVGGQGTLKLGDDCKAWIAREAAKIRSAERKVSGALKARDLFLIRSDDD